MFNEACFKAYKLLDAVSPFESGHIANLKLYTLKSPARGFVRRNACPVICAGAGCGGSCGVAGCHSTAGCGWACGAAA